MISAAQLLPSLADEEGDAPSTDRLQMRIFEKADEIQKKIPQHFILDDNLWPR